MRKIIFGLMILIGLGCKPSWECRNCIDDCEDAQFEGELPEGYDCFEFCVAKEICEAPVVRNHSKDAETIDIGNETSEDAGMCWQQCLCEFPEDPSDLCQNCLIEKGC